MKAIQPDVTRHNSRIYDLHVFSGWYLRLVLKLSRKKETKKPPVFGSGLSESGRRKRALPSTASEGKKDAPLDGQSTDSSERLINLAFWKHAEDRELRSIYKPFTAFQKRASTEAEEGVRAIWGVNSEQMAFESTEQTKLYLRFSEPQGNEARTRPERTTQGKEPMDNWHVYTYTVVRRVGSSDVRCNGNILGSEASTHQGHDLGSRVRQSSLQHHDNTSSDKSKETERKSGRT